MYLLKFAILLYITVIFSSCTIYKSPDRKDFESSTASFKIQNLKPLACSQTSVKEFSTASKLVSIINAEKKENSVFLWEHQVSGQAIFESDNLNETYCLYENI